MPLAEGSQAPDFALTGIDGKEYRLSEALQKGPLLAVFVKTTCPACDLVMPYLKRLSETYRRNDCTYGLCPRISLTPPATTRAASMCPSRSLLISPKSGPSLTSGTRR